MGIVMNQLRSGRAVDLSQVHIEELLTNRLYQPAITHNCEKLELVL